MTVVKVQHEIAAHPGIVLLEQYLNPKETDEVKIEGDKLVACPPLPQWQTVTLKVLRYRFDRERFIVTSGT